MISLDYRKEKQEKTSKTISKNKDKQYVYMDDRTA